MPKKSTKGSPKITTRVSNAMEKPLTELARKASPQERRSLKEARKAAQTSAREIVQAADQATKASLLQHARSGNPRDFLPIWGMAKPSCGDVCTPSCAGGCAGGCLIGGGSTIGFGILGGTAGGGTVGLEGSSFQLLK